MRQLVLEKIVVSGFPPVNKRCLWLKGNTFYFWYKGAWRSVDSNIDVNEDYIDEKVTETVSQELESIIGNAPDNLDTLGELAEQFAKHEEEATERQSDIEENKAAIDDLKEQINGLDPNSGGWNEVS
jgi:hypothetical protein